MNVLLPTKLCRLFMRNHLSNFAATALLLGLGALSLPAWSYDSAVHQQLTFLAAKQISRCERTAQLQPLSALDTRYVVRANAAQADRNLFWRMFRWNYYNRDSAQGRGALGLIDTRFHDHFDGLNAELKQSGDRQERLKTFGRILSYLQDVTSPPRVVPVFTSRWWRLSFSDRFDRFDVDVERLENAIQDSCAELAAFAELVKEPDQRADLQALLVSTAEGTIASVRAPIEGLPAQWTAFWQFGAADEFGSYGPAGNKFGERTGFQCGSETCLLLENDPLYQDFAHVRHTAAVTVTMKAMLLMQHFEHSAVAAARPQ